MEEGRKEKDHGQMFEHVPRNEILGENLTFPFRNFVVLGQCNGC